MHSCVRLTFDPWNTTDEFRPLGNLNRARKAVYDASAAHRLGYRWEKPPPLRNVVVGAVIKRTFRVVNQYVEWHRLPVRVGLLNLEAFRQVLRMTLGSPAWNPHATLALVTERNIAWSSPRVHRPKDSPTSLFRSMAGIVTPVSLKCLFQGCTSFLNCSTIQQFNDLWDESIRRHEQGGWTAA